MNLMPSFVTAALLEKYRRGSHLFLCFDYDGTLVPIVDEPRLARLPAFLIDALRQLQRLPRVRVGIISGRDHSSLKEMIAVPGVFLAGTSGLELDFNGVRITHPNSEAFLPLLRSAAAELQQLVLRFPGAWVESKRLGLTLHFRQAEPRQVTELCHLALLTLARYRENLRICGGPMALEITPNVGWTKGTAIRLFLERYATPLPYALYAGDGANDVDAFQAVLEHEGVTIGVGNDAPSIARARILTPAVLGRWLCDLLPILAGI